MTRFAFALLLALAGGAALSQPPAPDVVTRGLGRAKPAAAYDYGHYRAVKGQDGKTRYFPRLSKHADFAKLAAALPASVDWSAKAPNVVKRMYGNDRYGDCVIASRYHQLGFWTGADTGAGLEADDSEVISTYQSACGRGDNGCDMSAVNQYQQQVGIKVKGVVHKTRGSVSVDHTNKELVKAAIYLFGGVNIGLNLPNAWYQSADGSVWDATNTGIVGGHEVQGFGYTDKGVLISTWAGTRTITWAAFVSSRWIDEVYATRSADWTGADNLAPNGIDVAGLDAAFAAIQGGQVPPLPDPQPPTPPPGPNPPPAPGPSPTPTGPFTGTITTTETFKAGVSQGKVTTVGGLNPANQLEAELKASGVSPVVILDVLKLVADVKNKAPKATIMEDVFKLLSDLGGPVPSVDPVGPRRDPAPIPKSSAAPPCCGQSSRLREFPVAA